MLPRSSSHSTEQRQDKLCNRAVRRGEYFLKLMDSPRAPKECQVLGTTFTLLPGVFSPALSRSTEFFVRQLVPRVKGKVLFEVGCGSGVVSILCAVGGAARVTCTDVSDAAVRCAEVNVLRHDVGHIVEVINASNFNAVKQRYDIVFFALPYVYVPDIGPIVSRFGPLAYSIFDEGYLSQRTFLVQAPSVVKPGGEILLGFSKVGDVRRFLRNVRQARCDTELVAAEREGRADNRLYRILPNQR